MYLLLFLLWILFNGKVTGEIIAVGVFVTIALAFLMRELFGYTLRRELRLYKKAPIFICYVFVLLWEIIKANVDVMRFIINEKRTIEPTLVTFDADLRTDLGRFLLANSITLTPGTITVRAEGSRFSVHCLKRSMLDTSENSVFLRWIRRLEA